MSDPFLESEYFDELNRLAKWRAAFAGWQLGTRAASDPEAQAVRDTRELLLLLRVEVNALTALCLEAKLFTKVEWMGQVINECAHLHRSLERQFPGFRATDKGLSIDPERAAETTKGWRL